MLHESLKMTPAEPARPSGTSARRISALFFERLARQFPVVSPHHTVALKNANEFARELGVHTNHLNKALKQTTGKTTTKHIADKLTDEARALLRHSDWSIADIAYALGFEHTSNFNAFFRKQTGLPPHQYRRSEVAVSYEMD